MATNCLPSSHDSTEQKGFDKLIAVQGETCVMVGEDCFFWVKKSGQVQTNIHKLTHHESHL
jgi:uncharacterized protein YdeI (BOF family)